MIIGVDIIGLGLDRVAFHDLFAQFAEWLRRGHELRIVSLITADEWRELLEPREISGRQRYAGRQSDFVNVQVPRAEANFAEFVADDLPNSLIPALTRGKAKQAHSDDQIEQFVRMANGCDLVVSPFSHWQPFTATPIVPVSPVVGPPDKSIRDIAGAVS